MTEIAKNNSNKELNDKIRAARSKTDNIPHPLIKERIVSSIKSAPKFNLDNVKNQNTEKVRIKANKFVNKLNSVDSKNISVHSNSAKIRLMEMRFGNKTSKTPDSGNLTKEMFNMLMEGRKFTTDFVNQSGEKEVIIHPNSIKICLESIPTPKVRKHRILDNFENIPPTSTKIADLQQHLGVNMNGYFGVETFNTLNQNYLDLLIANNKEELVKLEKLMLTLVKLFGPEIKYSLYMKGLLVCKTYLSAIEQSKNAELDKLDKLMFKYLPPSVFDKLKFKVEFVKNLNAIFQLTSNKEKLEKMDFLVKNNFEYFNNSDKLRALTLYKENFLLDNFAEDDINNQIKLLNSLIQYSKNRNIASKSHNHIKELLLSVNKSFPNKIDELKSLSDKFTSLV